MLEDVPGAPSILASYTRRPGWEQRRINTMRNALAAVSMACVLALPALAAETSNFNVETTRDLVALCSAQPGDPVYPEAQQFCYGYMVGMAQLHRELVGHRNMKPLACPQYEVTREELVRAFLDWGRKNPAAMDELPAEGVIHAAAAAWPCRS